MFLAFILLGLVIAAAPLAIIFDYLIVDEVVAILVATTLAVISFRIRPGEAQFFLKIVVPIALIAVVPLLWMIVQVLPLASLGLVHPIWASAASSLGRPIIGSVSIDPGATILSFLKYLSLLGTAVAAAALAIDRLRAKWILFLLLLAAAAISAIFLLAETSYFTYLRNNPNWPVISGVATECTAIGVIVSLVLVFHLYDRRVSKKKELSVPWIWPDVLVFPSGLLCCIAFFSSAEKYVYIAVGCGLAIFLVVIAIRHFHLRTWGISAVCTAMSLVVVTFVMFTYSGRSFSFVLAFAHAPAAVLSATQRILSDVGWLGTGAGSFYSILPIYGVSVGSLSGPEAPSTASRIIIEMGLPFYWLALVLVFALFAVLLRGGWRRQRDSAFPAVGASCLVTVFFLAYCNSNIFHTPASILTATVIGVAVAQRRSRLI